MSNIASTPRGSRVHISFFGKTNAGKSSLINALTKQDIAIVSSRAGTTGDPVYKTMELPGLGPCVLIDTAGLDDTTELAAARTEKTRLILQKTDIALFVSTYFDEYDKKELDLIISKNIPVIPVLNMHGDIDYVNLPEGTIKVNAYSGAGTGALLEQIAKTAPREEISPKLLGEIISAGDTVILVTPIDSSAPKGRLILPQQQLIREILESGAFPVLTQNPDIALLLNNLSKPPRLVVTDSQVFAPVSESTPENIMLTSFSVIFARAKGDLDALTQGAEAVAFLKNGDRILIAEACTHHAQNDDIARVKIPALLKKHTGKELIFEFTSGAGYKDNLEDYALVVHCGGCMLNRREMNSRISAAAEVCVPIVNFGVLLAYLTGALRRALEPFGINIKEGDDFANCKNT